MKVILISGKATCGKDTFASILENELTLQNKKVLICHFADLVKYVATKFFNWNGEKDEYGRTLLQHIGTENIRSVYPNFWVDFIVDILKVYNGSWDYVLIPDTRFPNEVDIPVSRGLDAVSVRVERPNHTSGLTEEQLNHQSEIALDNYIFDYTIINDGSIEDLRNNTKSFIEMLNKEI